MSELTIDNQPEPEEIREREHMEKLIKRNKARKDLLITVQSGDLKTKLSKVAYILNLFPDTRNSDVTLQLKYWEIFQSYKEGDPITPEKLYELERLTSIARARAKIQNEYGLFVATSEKVRRYRQNKEEIEREKALASKPSVPSLHIYADESGKTGGEQFAVVGSLWIPDTGEARRLNFHIKEWVEKKKGEGIQVPKEFHFTEMKRMQLEIYKSFFDEVLSNCNVFSFKVVAANKSKIRGKNLDETIFALYYQVIHLGIEHEVNTGRITLPRDVLYHKDEEEGTDKLRMIELEQLLIERFNSYFDGKLTLQDFSSIPSKSFPLVQVADLIAGSISRLLNRTIDGARNHKDEFAEYVAEKLDIDYIRHDIDSINKKIKFRAEKDLAFVHVFE